MKEETKYFTRKIAIGAAIGMVLIAVFIFGAYQSCSNGEGTLNGFSCINYKVIDTCEEAGKLYILPSIDTSKVINFNLTT